MTVLKLLWFSTDCPLISHFGSTSGSWWSSSYFKISSFEIEFTSELSLLSWFSSLLLLGLVSFLSSLSSPILLSFESMKTICFSFNNTLVASTSSWISWLFLRFSWRWCTVIVSFNKSNLFFLWRTLFITRSFSIGWAIRRIYASLSRLLKILFNFIASDSSKSSPSYSSTTRFIFSDLSGLVIWSMILLNLSLSLLGNGVTL